MSVLGVESRHGMHTSRKLMKAYPTLERHRLVSTQSEVTIGGILANVAEIWIWLAASQ